METIKFVALCLFLFVAILLFNFYLAYKEVSKPNTEKLVKVKSLRFLRVPDPNDPSDMVSKGRERKPSKNWFCTRFATSFILPIDPATVPIPWWFGEATKSFTNKNPCPWACPNCGTYAYTVPT